MAGDGRQQPVQAQNYLPDIPLSLDVDTQNLLTSMVQQLQAVQPNPAPPGVPLGLSATAATLGNLIKWAPVVTADSYRVYRGTTNSFAAAVVVQQLQGNANTSWYDPFQAAAASGQYYWVTALNASGVPGPTSAMLTITAGINVNDIFSRNITATGTITGATLQTATSGARIVIDSTNGLRAINASNIVVLAADLSGNVAMTGTFQTASSSGRVVIDSTYGLRAYNSSGVLQTQVDVAAGYVYSNSFTGLIDGAALVCANSSAFVQVDSSSGGLVSIISGGIHTTFILNGVISSAGFSGSGAALTALSASNISTGTLTSIPISMGANNVSFTSGYGIASGGTSFACVTTDAQIYQSSTLCANFNTTDAKIRIGGTLYTLSVVAGIVNAT